jgi:hypothetical protein
MRDFGFGVLLWLGQYWPDETIERFHGWLDNSLPWRLRARLKAMWEENKSLCTQLQTVQWDNIELNRTLREAMSKMTLPLRRLTYPLGQVHEHENSILPVKTISYDFKSYQVSISLDMYAFPHYSPTLLDYMAHHTADQMTDHMNEHIYKEVKKIYEKEFLGEIDGS